MNVTEISQFKELLQGVSGGRMNGRDRNLPDDQNHLTQDFRSFRLLGMEGWAFWSLAT
jgi:hypothetical protein